MISSRTLSKGWKAPPLGGIPSASKLYFLKFAVFQEPLVYVSRRCCTSKCKDLRCKHLGGQIGLWFRRGRAEVCALVDGEPLALPDSSRWLSIPDSEVPPNSLTSGQ